MNHRQQKIADLCDGYLSSKEIADLCDDNIKYVQKTMLAFDLPRKKQGAQVGKENHQYKTGKRIDRDGYVLVTAPLDHPHARMRKGRNFGLMYEHRLVLESMIGRYLDPLETVDHIDGLRLHNCPSNLRLFDSNAQHLKATIRGQTPLWSKEGLEKQKVAPALRSLLPKIDTYDQMKRNGDARLRQILLCWLTLPKDSTYLLGTHHHLAKAGIDETSHSSLERALGDLYRKYA